MSRPGSQIAPQRRLAIIAPDWASLVRLRGDFIAHVLARRHRVLCLAPDHSFQGDHLRRLEELGAECVSYPLTAEDVRWLPDRRSIRQLAAKLADWRPHAALAYHTKPMLVGSLAARRARVPRIVPLVTDVGEALAADKPPRRWLRLVRAAFAASHAAVFHNAADVRRLGRFGLIGPRMAIVVVPGAGVDLERNRPLPLPECHEGLTFLMLSALRHGKGVIEFCEAATLVRSRRADARFILAGPEWAGADAVSLRDLARYSASLELRGDHDNIGPLLAQAHVVVLPSRREGLSRTLLEALAAGRPVIASDIPGCREAVDELVNGILVAPRSPQALAGAMERLLAHPALLAPMARASRLKAERLFDVREVNAKLTEVLGLG
jgi:glycosyltransferase involved in cell wall biosynthesis